MADEFSGVSTEGCEEQSWSPEVITLYGDAETINRKLANFDMNLERRRIFGFVVEGGGRAAGSFYERTGDKEATVYRWSGEADPSLHGRIADEIQRNRGVNC